MNEPTSNFTCKNILVTGGCGFIGSHTVILLVKKYPQYNIINLDVLDYCAGPKNLNEIVDYPNYKFIHGDIRSADFISYILATEKIDTIMHFAAQTHVDNSFGNSFNFTKVNVLGTHVLLEAAKQAKIRRFIHVSTDEVKGETETHTENELFDSDLQPTNPYAATKAAGELLVQSYHHSFDLPVLITRSNNVYGPHQFPEKIIPKFICLLQRNRKCCVHGDGSNKRNYVYVEDVANAFDLILHKGLPGETYNIAVSEVKSNLDVVKSLVSEFGLKGSYKDYCEFVEDRCFNDKRYHIDPAKMEALGWKPEVSWEDGIKKTIDWYCAEKNADNWMSTVESALVPHPRVGMTVSRA
eukprot:CAMPEP_0174252138 /NCGR_PEP_ID=MMETSP0439-20130205/1739_1 /TAXON_ID=0 /ORGANISM="Stereomyxa ramosa, Strain Chinc5" /LENGTH=353 /DNA_ID=CAMNT_0015332635 /DNA_START=41 /DNA_END=1102 /DNA_ORIENTATION=+